ncbi:MAG: hypothetical protein EAZ88_09365 [Oscillatoriales cyanobacterium]|nr:MAG: hypothetical protein EAZ88_09365 [Oscillatoriales cyanobacterium]
MFPFASQPVPLPVSPPKDSTELEFAKNISDRLFQAICGAIGGIAAHSVRSAPQYFPLFIVGCIAAGGFLAIVPPRDKDFLGLYRSGALILVVGALLPFWDLLAGIPQQVAIGAVVVAIVLAIALISVLGRS